MKRFQEGWESSEGLSIKYSTDSALARACASFSEARLDQGALGQTCNASYLGAEMGELPLIQGQLQIERTLSEDFWGRKNR